MQEIIDLVKECGVLLKNASNKEVVFKNDNRKDLLTNYDIQIQNILKEGLLKIMPEASFLGEEGEKCYKKEGYCFVCDPIDGTTNFVMDYRGSGISVALLKDGKPVLGVIYNPYLDEMYFAEKGKGATCNGSKIQTTEIEMKNSIVIFGTGGTRTDETFDLAKKYFHKGIDVRRFGCAVVDLTNVARGTACLFFEHWLNPWDFSAGVLIVEEAGGVVLQENGEPIEDYFKPQAIFAFGNRKEADIYINEIKTNL